VAPTTKAVWASKNSPANPVSAGIVYTNVWFLEAAITAGVLWAGAGATGAGMVTTFVLKFLTATITRNAPPTAISAFVNSTSKANSNALPSGKETSAAATVVSLK
jgi:hypothetical protein